MTDQPVLPSPRAAGPRHPHLPTNLRTWIFAGIGIIAFAFGGLGTWASMAPLDSAAIATGVVVLEGNRKTIQHLEGGIVEEILVRNGMLFRKATCLSG